jgi:hypothetical protein
LHVALDVLFRFAALRASDAPWAVMMCAELTSPRRTKKATLAGQGPAWPRSAPAEAGLIVKVSSQALSLQ